MSQQQIEQWLLEKLESQISKAKDAMDEVIFYLDERNWEEASKHHRQIDYWLSRAKNTQRLLDEME